MYVCMYVHAYHAYIPEPPELHSCFCPGTAFQIGSSPQSALKCVEDPGYLHCDDSAEQVGRTGEFPDTFHIYHENEKRLGGLMGFSSSSRVLLRFELLHLGMRMRRDLV